MSWSAIKLGLAFCSLFVVAIVSVGRLEFALVFHATFFLFSCDMMSTLPLSATVEPPSSASHIAFSYKNCFVLLSNSLHRNYIQQDSWTAHKSLIFSAKYLPIFRSQLQTFKQSSSFCPAFTTDVFLMNFRVRL